MAPNSRLLFYVKKNHSKSQVQLDPPTSYCLSNKCNPFEMDDLSGSIKTKSTIIRIKRNHKNHSQCPIIQTYISGRLFKSLTHLPSTHGKNQNENKIIKSIISINLVFLSQKYFKSLLNQLGKLCWWRYTD